MVSNGYLGLCALRRAGPTLWKVFCFVIEGCSTSGSHRLGAVVMDADTGETSSISLCRSMDGLFSKTNPTNKSPSPVEERV